MYFKFHFVHGSSSLNAYNVEKNSVEGETLTCCFCRFKTNNKFFLVIGLCYRLHLSKVRFFAHDLSLESCLCLLNIITTQPKVQTNWLCHSFKSGQSKLKIYSSFPLIKQDFILRGIRCGSKLKDFTIHPS